MLAQLKRTAAVGIAAALVLLLGGAPQAAADDPTTTPVAVASDIEVPGEGADEQIGSTAPTAPSTPVETTPPETTEVTGEPSPSTTASATPTPQTRAKAAAVPMAEPVTPAAPAACAGVWVALQNADDQEPVLACVEPVTGRSALELVSGLYTVDAPGGYLSQVNGLPENTDWETNGNVFWSLCSATTAEDGTLSWAIASVGAGELVPTAGTVVGFRLSTWTDDPATQCPAVSSAPVGTPAPTSPTDPPREPASGSALDAAGWVRKNLPAAGDPDGQWQAILALATVDQCSYAPAVKSQLTLLKKEASEYVAGNPGRAGRLAIVAAAVGEDPYDFGGVDLIRTILDGTRADGQVVPGANPFSQSLALIGLTRAGEPVPSEMISALLGMQNAAGAFGFGSGDSFWPDLDATGLAIQALAAFVDPTAGAAVDSATAWLLSQQEASGMWPNEWGSPVNTTGVVGSSLELIDRSSGEALTWLKSQQLADGGFPNSLDGDESDLFATAEALFLLTDSTYLTVSLDLEGACADPGSDDGDDDSEELPNTGANDATGLLGIAAVVLVASGSALVGIRRSRRA